MSTLANASSDQVITNGIGTSAPLLDPHGSSRIDGVATCLAREVQQLVAAGGTDERIGAAVELARRWSTELPRPGLGATRKLWQAQAAAAVVDLSVARVLEPHLDALAILDQARDQGHQIPAGGQRHTWGVYAAEGPGTRVEAQERSDGGWRLTGRKPWCSLASRLDRALVTAWCGDGQERGLFALDLRAPGVTVHEQGWVAHGLAGVTSGPIDLEGVPASAVGPPGWYLTRPGFAWGGMGVAACWWGGAAGLVRRMHHQAGTRELDQVAAMHLGAADAALHAAGATLALAADAVDRGTAEGQGGAALALRVRRAVRVAAEEVLERAGHTLGPAPQVSETEHAARLADLQLYLRQEHAERDEAALGRLLRAEPPPPSTWGVQ
ncbi:MAG: acyl-CoA dehydrogenase [Ornithinimicrobium sp.]|uniref:acyl-CoA dehydrogenase n=1 Tax=Ornithinimicrobium sp. TaxID=1977084 RepID=UPI003D9ACE9A